MRKANRNRNNQLKQAIKNSMVNKFEYLCDFREVHNLYKVIDDDEYIVQAVNGFFSRDRDQNYSYFHSTGSNGTGLIILTNKEIILFNHYLFWGSEYPSIPLQKLHSITPDRNVIWGSIDFDDGSAHPFRASHILAWKCARFKQAVDNQISKMNDSQQNNQESPVQQLQQLNSMYQNHQLSLDEYQHMKNKIVND